MYSRILSVENQKSFFLVGPRGTGKSTWVSKNMPDALVFDLLDPEIYTELLSSPGKLAELIPKNHQSWVIIDEVQRIPEILNVIHSLIEKRKIRFGLTGSSARKLRKSGVNLLAGRALSYNMFPLTAMELGDDFDFMKSMQFGQLPSIFSEPDPKKYLASYVKTYLREEVLQEGLTRNLAAFSRFLSAASFSQASVLNISDVARDAGVERKVVENYFSILEDLLIAERIPIFNKRAKRKTISHPKFYFFDVGVYRAIRPSGPLDEADIIPGAAFETLVWQEIRAINAYCNLEYEIYFWRTVAGLEVDFVLYGKSKIIAVEVKSSKKVKKSDLRGLIEFRKDYPQVVSILVYGGDLYKEIDDIKVIPVMHFLKNLRQILVEGCV